MYAVRTSTGQGLYATQMIPLGTRILEEEPIISTSVSRDVSYENALKELTRQYDKLDDFQKAEFNSMYDSDPFHPIWHYFVRVFRTVSLPQKDNQQGLFVVASRIRHSCQPNAVGHWNENTKRHTVHALRTIHEDEEIYISWIAITGDRATRQALHKKKFGFPCSCYLCTSPPSLSAEHDRKKNEIASIDLIRRKHGDRGVKEWPLKTLSRWDRIAQLHSESSTAWPSIFLQAALLCYTHSDHARATAFLRKAMMGYLNHQGDDSSNYLRCQAAMGNPVKKIKSTGLTQKWRSSTADIPTHLDPESMQWENWLWRREKEQSLREPKDLRDHANFPSFYELPVPGAPDSDFHETDNPEKPLRHWCFLAEILSVEYKSRHIVKVKDVAGNLVSVVFGTNDLGERLLTVNEQELKVGWTVAVLYGEQHAESERVCVQDQARLMECEDYGWNEKGHRSDCDLLKDQGLASFLMFDWHDFHRFIQFPIENPIEKEKKLLEDMF
ncbi:SET domain-containing protein [Microthyrium microscopicum]|uniref:SET domain-containing protein n=1 Tax=Microthyrium microscopicum TaxID=703497 RepID=A0A6A6U6L5_9PEZI|nr:SET domain-containing protein [Microthyrium microscopicum]